MRNEKCNRKSTCDDYKYNHCDGCGANKPTGDLISREALKEEINKKRIVGRFNTIQIIDNAPTVADHSVEIAQKSIELGRSVGRTEGAIESQRPQGGWIFNGFCCSSTRYKCNKCGYLTLVKISPCPNCGADMRGE